MTILYVGNASRQASEFVYRLPGSANVRKQVIRAGMQEKIGGDWSTPDLDAVLAHHAKYGLVNADTIDRGKDFHGTCYSLDKPIRVNRIVYLMERNLTALVDLGKKTREECAVVENLNFERTLIENGRSERIQEFEMTIQQENQDPRNDVPQMSEGITVKRQDKPTGRVKLRGKNKAA